MQNLLTASDMFGTWCQLLKNLGAASQVSGIYLEHIPILQKNLHEIVRYSTNWRIPRYFCAFSFNFGRTQLL